MANTSFCVPDSSAVVLLEAQETPAVSVFTLLTVSPPGLKTATQSQRCSQPSPQSAVTSNVALSEPAIAHPTKARVSR